MVRYFFAAVLAAVFAFASPADAARLTSVKIKEYNSTPAMRPSWPIPNEPNQLFYLQRSQNSNTIVYTSLFDGNGNLNPKRPAQAYWRRYNTDGARKPLKKIEQRFAYGLNIKKRSTPGEFTVSLKPLPEIKMLLRQTGPGKAELIADIGGKQVRAIYAFITIDESGLIPKVTDLTLFGRDLATGKTIAETYSVKGGAITQ